MHSPDVGIRQRTLASSWGMHPLQAFCKWKGCYIDSLLRFITGLSWFCVYFWYATKTLLHRCSWLKGHSLMCKILTIGPLCFMHVAMDMHRLARWIFCAFSITTYWALNFYLCVNQESNRGSEYPSNNSFICMLGTHCWRGGYWC